MFSFPFVPVFVDLILMKSPGVTALVISLLYSNVLLDLTEGQHASL